MQQESQNQNLKSLNIAKSKVSIKPEIQKIIDSDDECINQIMDVLYNPSRVNKYQSNTTVKRVFEEGILSETTDNVINFDAMGIEDAEMEHINSDEFLSSFGIK